MSKGNFLMGTATGKLGEMVLYRADGEQRARTYLRKFKNPQTVLQQTQRMKFRSAGLSYRLFKRSVRKTQKKENQTYFNSYMSKNIDLSPFLTKEDAIYWDSIGASPVAPYVLTVGPLTTPPFYQPLSLPLSGSSGTSAKLTYSFATGQTPLSYIIEQAQLLGFLGSPTTGATQILTFDQICQCFANGVNTHLVFCFATGVQETSKNSSLTPSALQCFEGGSLRLLELTAETFPVAPSLNLTVSSGAWTTSETSLSYSLSSNGITVAFDLGSGPTGDGAKLIISTDYILSSGAGAAVWVASDKDGGITSTAQINLTTAADTFYKNFTNKQSAAYLTCVESWIKSDSSGDANVYTDNV